MRFLPGEFFWAPGREEREQAFPAQRGPGRSPPDLIIMMINDDDDSVAPDDDDCGADDDDVDGMALIGQLATCFQSSPNF